MKKDHVDTILHLVAAVPIGIACILLIAVKTAVIGIPMESILSIFLIACLVGMAIGVYGLIKAALGVKYYSRPVSLAYRAVVLLTSAFWLYRLLVHSNTGELIGFGLIVLLGMLFLVLAFTDFPRRHNKTEY